METGALEGLLEGLPELTGLTPLDRAELAGSLVLEAGGSSQSS